MRKLILTLTLILLSSTSYAAMAFLVRQYTSGVNRICIYNHLGSEVAITVSITDLCPLTLDL